jgi:hypothetical protein
MLNEKFTENISAVTENDRSLFESYLNNTPVEKPGINYENSFEYIQMYFNLGKFQAYKYLDNSVLVLFGLSGTGNKTHVKLFKPLGSDLDTGLGIFIDMVTAMKKTITTPITLTCLSNHHFKKLKSSIPIKKVKSFDYYIYDTSDIAGLKGNKWKNVRQKINSFKTNYPKVRIEDLNDKNFKKVIHFISEWRGDAIKRGFSYIDVAKNKLGVKYYQNKIDNKNLWSRVYYIKGKVESFQLSYRLITQTDANACGHTIGVANNDIPGLSEYTQIDMWRHMEQSGIRYINDGPSWRPGLKRYKSKFNPCDIQQVIECTL